jgi:hypothetical protein
MTENKSGGAVRRFVTRVLAAGALVVLYAISTMAVTGVTMTATDSSAYAQRGGRGGRGGRRGGARGRGRGRGRGIWRGGVWWPWIAPGWCHHIPTSRRVWCDIW